MSRSTYLRQFDGEDDGADTRRCIDHVLKGDNRACAKAEYRFSHYKTLDLIDGEHLDRHNILVGAGVDF